MMQQVTGKTRLSTNVESVPAAVENGVRINTPKSSHTRYLSSAVGYGVQS